MSFQSGFCTLVGRPNVGKSTLLNSILGTKVTIVSDKPQTTRTEVRGVLHRPESQIVFVDTPGIHKPRTLLGERLNDTATGAIRDVDAVCLVLDATAPLGRGDRFVAARVPRDAIVVVTKVDIASPDEVLAQLAAGRPRPQRVLPGVGYHGYRRARAARCDHQPVCRKGRRTTRPTWWPTSRKPRGSPSSCASSCWRWRDEVPHSIATRVTEWEPPRVRVEILVERDSQKGIVIGKGGAVLKQVGIAVREQLPPGTYIELFVKVDKDWQRRAAALERLGY